MRLLFAVLAMLALAGTARAEVACLLIADAREGTVLHREGDGCDEGIGPASSFKFALSVMGFDAGILTAPDEPAWPYEARYEAVRAIDKETTTPRRWLKESVLWYSRVLVEKLGAERFAAYVRDFGYGNTDVSGDPGAGNGMTHSWLNSSLQITPAEQLSFVSRFLRGELPVDISAIRQTVAAMPHFSADGWDIQGKTGTGYIKEADGQRGNRQFGWFVGWATRGDQALAFSYLQKNARAGGSALGLRVRDDLLARWGGLVD